MCSTEQQTIVLGDCLVQMAELEAGSIDVICSSPPYNLNIAYNSYIDRKPREQYLLWLRDVARAMCRVLKDGGSLFLNVGASNADPWLSHDVAAVFRDYLVLQNHIVWVKSISIGDDTFGHFKPITSERFLNHNHEAIFHFSHTGHTPLDRLGVGVPFKDKSNIARRGHAQDKRCAGDVWFIPYDTVRSKRQKFNHPAGFPVALAKRCIMLHGVTPELIVLDPFAGTGSTLVAAAELGCQGIGFEIDPVYVKAAMERLLGVAPGRVWPTADC